MSSPVHRLSAAVGMRIEPDQKKRFDAGKWASYGVNNRRHARKLPGGGYVAIAEPMPLALCRQWFVGIANDEGRCVLSTHTPNRKRRSASGDLALSERAAKVWAWKWALSKGHR